MGLSVSVFQKDRECFIWSKEQILSQNINLADIDSPLHPFLFNLDNTDIKLFANDFSWYIDNHKDNIKDLLSDINIIILYSPCEGSNFDRLIHRFTIHHPNHKFILIYKFVEDYYITQRTMHDDIPIQRLNSISNLRVIWDIKTDSYSHFIFHPKLAFHHYHNQPAFFTGLIFEHAHSIFKNLPKQYRIGFHMNRPQNEIRMKLMEKFESVKSNPHIFYTSIQNYKSELFSPSIPQPNLSPTNHWYLYQFIEQTSKSHLEFVYETHTPSAHEIYVNKWTEKTHKHLFLGKPFVFTDPIAFALMEVYGLQNYKSIYTDDLWNYYSQFKYDDKIFFYRPKRCTIDRRDLFKYTEENIDWLLSLSDDEFEQRIKEANDVAEINRKHINTLIYETSLLNTITDKNIWLS